MSVMNPEHSLKVVGMYISLLRVNLLELNWIKRIFTYSHSSGTATPFPWRTWDLLIEQGYNESRSGG